MGVAHPHLKYFGYTDAVTFHQKSKSVVLVDWKTCDKYKTSLAKTFDNPLQVAAYVGALNHDPNYSFQIENALIVLAYNDGKRATVLTMNKPMLSIYWKEWLKRCALYHEIRCCS